MNRLDRSKNSPRILFTAPLFAALLAWVDPSCAADYDVTHNFTLRPRGNVVPQVQAVYYAHAWGLTRRPDCSNWDVAPGAGTQPVGWGGFGTDRLLSKGAIRHRDGASTVPATQGRVNVAAGGMATTTWTADAQACVSARAQANSEITVNAFGAGTAVTGTIRAHGFATAVAPPPRYSSSYAFSMAMVEARGGRQMRNGTIKWGKVVRDVVKGTSRARRQVDPIEYTVTDRVTGEIFTGTLLSVEVDIPASPFGGFVWEGNRMQITASNLTFRVAFPSTNTSLQGELLIEVENGMVTNSAGTGHYAGLAPAVGAKVPLTLAVASEVEFDYDLGDHNGNELDVELDLHGAGEAAEEAATDVPTLFIALPDQETVLVEHYAPESPWLLDFATEPTPDAQWTQASASPSVTDDRVAYKIPRDSALPGQYFRLRKDSGTGDTQPPSFVALPECGAPILLVQFSEPVSLSTALTTGNYQISMMPPATMQVIKAEMQSPEMVMLTLNQPLLSGPTFTLEIKGVADLAGNAVVPGSAVSFDCAAGLK